MRRQIYYQYFVEGEDEIKLLNVLKSDIGCITAGKVDKFNPVQKNFTSARIRTLKPNTVIILIYDTDVEKIEILQKNIAFLERQTAIKEVFCIPQVKNLEEELMRACQIRSIEELTGSTSKKDYKRDIISCTNLDTRLKKCNFDIQKFWQCIPKNGFYIFGNDAEKIKKKKAGG